MPAPSPATSPHYVECARSLGRLHSLIQGGEGDSAQADEIRDVLDELWTRLSPEEADQLRALSADLNTIGRVPGVSKIGPSHPRVDATDRTRP